MSVKIRPYRGGGWEVDIRVVSPDGTRQQRERKRAPIRRDGRSDDGLKARERVLFERLMNPPKDHTTEGGAHITRVRVAVPGRPRAGESAEAERDCIEGA